MEREILDHLHSLSVQIVFICFTLFGENERLAHIDGIPKPIRNDKRSCSASGQCSWKG